jgi:transposase
LDLDISQGTVTGGLQQLAPLFEPLYIDMCARNASESLWNADETRWVMFAELEGKVGHRWYLWLFRSQTTVVYVLAPTRAASVPEAHFGKDAQGIIVADRYSAYKVLLKNGKLRIAFCWAHVRRDFLGVAKDWAEINESWGLGWVDKIAELYQCNDQRLLVLKDPRLLIQADVQLRQAAGLMADQRRAELADPKLHPARRKVLESMERHWSGLILFIDHPEVPMDNNEGERCLRNPVIGRKNYYGSGSLWSGAMAAMLFSLFQTLLVWGINPRLWLTDYLQCCAEAGGKPPENATAFLPWKLNEKQLYLYRNAAQRGEDTS